MSNLYYSSVHSKQMFKWVWQDYVELSTSAKLIWRRFCSSCCFTSSAQKASFLGGVIGLTNWWRPSATIKSCFWVSAKHSLFDLIEHVALTLNKGIKLIIVFFTFFLYALVLLKSNQIKSQMQIHHERKPWQIPCNVNTSSFMPCQMISLEFQTWLNNM